MRFLRSLLLSAVVAGLLTPCVAAQTLTGGVGVDAGNPYAGKDPRVGKPQTTAPETDGNGGTRCSAPANWQLVKRDASTCWWFVLYPHVLDRVIVDFGRIWAIQNRGGTCTSDPFDPRKALCQRIYAADCAGDPPLGRDAVTCDPPLRGGTYANAPPPCADGTNGGGPNSTNYYGTCGSNVAGARPPPAPFGNRYVTDDARPSPPERAELADLVAQLREVSRALPRDAILARDEFFKGLIDDWAIPTAEFLAQKPGVPVAQLSATIGRFIDNDLETNGRIVQAAARQALAELRANPARFFGKNAPTIVNASLGARSAFVGTFGASARRLIATAKTSASFSRGGVWAGSNTARLPRVNWRPPLNPQCSATNCFWVAVAQTLRWRTNVAFTANPGLATPSNVVLAVLRNKFGGLNAKNPFHGKAGLLAHSFGIPVPSSQALIDGALSAAGDGGSGLVFVEFGTGTGHVFNVIRDAGKTIFWDAQWAMDGDLWFESATKVWFFRTD